MAPGNPNKLNLLKKKQLCTSERLSPSTKRSPSLEDKIVNGS